MKLCLFLRDPNSFISKELWCRYISLAPLQTGICLPILPYQPSRLDLHRLGGNQESRNPATLCQPELPTRGSSLCTRRCHLQGLRSRSLGSASVLREVLLRWQMTSGYFHFSIIPKGHSSGYSPISYNALERQHFVTGRRKGRVGF